MIEIDSRVGAISLSRFSVGKVNIEAQRKINFVCFFEINRI
jgi:hypothetical protein